MKKFINNTYLNKGYWLPIQNKFRTNASEWSQYPELSWFLDIRFNRLIAVVNKSVLKKFI